MNRLRFDQAVDDAAFVLLVAMALAAGAVLLNLT